tara:strand:- start:4390 stop:4764 length:375 start_codon:yes stop_codon:yes gene_type:complete
MKARIVDDGSPDTIVEYNGTKRRYSTEYRNSFDSEKEFLDSVFNDFYDAEGEQLDILYEKMEGDATICPEQKCGEWFSFDRPDEKKYNAVECDKCGWFMLLTRKLPEIPPNLHRRIVVDAETMF